MKIHSEPEKINKKKNRKLLKNNGTYKNGTKSAKERRFGLACLLEVSMIHYPGHDERVETERVETERLTSPRELASHLR